MLFDSLCKALQKLGEAASQALADAAKVAPSPIAIDDFEDPELDEEEEDHKT